MGTFRRVVVSQLLLLRLLVLLFWCMKSVLSSVLAADVGQDVVQSVIRPRMMGVLVFR